MALQWTDSPKPSPQMASSTPKLLHPVPKPSCCKGDKVFVLGWGDFQTKSKPRHSSAADQPAVLCEVADWGYHFLAHQHRYFVKVVQPDYADSIAFMCSFEHLVVPKFQPGTTLEVRDVDDRMNGVGLSKRLRVVLEVVEWRDGGVKYWIKSPEMDKEKTGKEGKKGKKEKKAKWIDIEEERLERMVEAANGVNKTTAQQHPALQQATNLVRNSFSVKNGSAP